MEVEEGRDDDEAARSVRARALTVLARCSRTHELKVIERGGGQKERGKSA